MARPGSRRKPTFNSHFWFSPFDTSLWSFHTVAGKIANQRYHPRFLPLPWPSLSEKKSPYVTGWELNIFCDLFPVNGIWHRERNLFEWKIVFLRLRIYFPTFASHSLISSNWNCRGMKLEPALKLALRQNHSTTFISCLKRRWRICIFCFFNLAHWKR